MPQLSLSPLHLVLLQKKAANCRLETPAQIFLRDGRHLMPDGSFELAFQQALLQIVDQCIQTDQQLVVRFWNVYSQALMQGG